MTVANSAVQGGAGEWLGIFVDASTPIIAAVTALAIAFIAYPWQRGRDRAFELRKEQRHHYREFIPQWLEIEDLLSEVRRAKGGELAQSIVRYGEIMRKADSLVFRMSLSSSPSVLKQLAEMHTAIYSAYRSFGVAVKDIYDNMPDGGSVPSDEIASILGGKIDELKSTHRSQFEELLFRMRSEEFDGSGRMKIEDPDAVLMKGMEDIQK